MPSTWLLHAALSAPMPMQMALDEILFRQMIDSPVPRENLKPVLRFYYASEPWVSLGYAYAGWKDAGEGPAAEQSAGAVPVCRRLTGGGEVLHGNDLMFTLIAPKAAHASFGSVRESYAAIHQWVKAALEELGHRPDFYAGQELPKGRECFLYPIESDLSVGGEKIAGGGQKRSLGIMMHQESIQMKRLGDPEDLRALLEKKFAAAFDARFETAPFWPELLIQAERLGDEKYRIRDAAGKHRT